MAPLTSDTAPARTARIASTHDPGDTAVVDGDVHRHHPRRIDVGRALVIVLSDGVDTSSWLRADAVLDTAKRADVVVYAVSAQAPVKPSFSADLTSLTGGRLFEGRENREPRERSF